MAYTFQPLEAALGNNSALSTFPMAFTQGLLSLGAAGCNGGPALRLGRERGPSGAARTDLGSCRLGNCTQGKYPGKLPLGKKSLGKFLTSLT